MLSRNIVLAAASFLLPYVGAQEQYTIEPSSVDITTRDAWCSQELSTCPIICEQIPPGGYVSNTCNSTTLEYTCTCQNGMSPNLTQYSLTLPFFICQEWGTQCVAGCNGDNSCASDCTQNHPCGALNPSKPNSTATVTTMSPTASSSGASATQVYGGLGDSGSSSNSQHNAAARLAQYGGIAGTIALTLAFGLGSILLL
ncbi:hypothetical protein F5Y16DRAFT_390861 [Xylariaceae sp. FL0255]|nr:hypothetical protein F5Y16DRAFT_390861 [Xylariaceae sp. FL0255]